MEQIIQEIQSTLGVLNLRSGLDILIVAIIIYWLLTLIQGTTAVMVVRGVAILLLTGSVLSNVLQLTMLSWLIRNMIPATLVAIPILFQPELRRALEQLGRAGGLIPHRGPSFDPANATETLAHAASVLAQRNLGALIVVEGDTALGEFARTGVSIDGAVSVELLLNIFHPGAPLHDGAVIVHHDRVVAAGCLLPLSDMSAAPYSSGTRHRAALGITEQTDAVCIVVSEESGKISLANHGRLVRDLDEEKLRRVLGIIHPTPGAEALRTFLRPRAAEKALSQ
ncbi:MAG TPA: diadenylate cyclase CdaA [Chloroflexota bacterium]|nr:diadenylate cyclase CdaA [Chloroflexota bacterium]